MDLTGGLFAVDRANSRTVRLDANGRVAQSFPGHYPQSVAVDRHGFVYVTEKSTRSVVVFNPNGRRLPDVGGQLQSPAGLDVLVLRSGSKLIYVADRGGDCVSVLKSDGSLLTKIGEHPPFWAASGDSGTEAEVQSPSDVALGVVGGQDFVFVADTGKSRIAVFTSDGVFVRSISSFGHPAQRMYAPTKVAVGAAVRNHGTSSVVVFVADVDRVLAFEVGVAEGIAGRTLEIGAEWAIAAGDPRGLAASGRGCCVAFGDSGIGRLEPARDGSFAFEGVPWPAAGAGPPGAPAAGAAQALPSWARPDAGPADELLRREHRDRNELARQDDDIVCPICTESFKIDPETDPPRPAVAPDVVATQCGHRFHRVCLQKYLQTLQRSAWNGRREGPSPCPTCRGPVDGIVSERNFPDWLKLCARCALPLSARGAQPLSARRALCAPMQLRL